MISLKRWVKEKQQPDSELVRELDQLFENEDLNDLSKSSSNSWVPRLELFHDSQPGPHIFLLCRWYDASISVCLQILRSPLTELHVLYCAKQKKHCDTGTMSLHKFHLQP
ncbi:hypothetical protein D623_10032986 [Myotis brandtii]|uniref:Uncharacterized protein n=1 Tax=Myotis brandtii TaxID=109478 RepID=S7Q528_MYOBR|nr:hypothetical protein D623_10032986 [Myotis brandtii]